MTESMVAIFTVIKNEREYLDDFLKYHSNLGIDIYVFEDLFSESHKDICQKYRNVYLYSIKELYNELEIPNLINNRIKHVPPQTEYINKGLKFIHSLEKYDWCWLIDIDEYITFTEPLEQLIDKYKEYDAISVYWQNYGCSGYIYKPTYDKPIYEIYTEKCGYELYRDRRLNNITKFCVNMNKWNQTMWYKIHDATVNWIKVDFTKDHAQEVFEPLYLRHYITKSFEEYCYKLFVRGMMHPEHRTIQSFFEMQPQYKDKILNDKELQSYLNKKYNISIKDDKNKEN